MEPTQETFGRFSAEDQLMMESPSTSPARKVRTETAGCIIHVEFSWFVSTWLCLCGESRCQHSGDFLLNCIQFSKTFFFYFFLIISGTHAGTRNDSKTSSWLNAAETPKWPSGRVLETHFDAQKDWLVILHVLMDTQCEWWWWYWWFCGLCHFGCSLW